MSYGPSAKTETAAAKACESLLRKCQEKVLPRKTLDLKVFILMIGSCSQGFTLAHAHGGQSCPRKRHESKPEGNTAHESKRRGRESISAHLMIRPGLCKCAGAGVGHSFVPEGRHCPHVSRSSQSYVPPQLDTNSFHGSQTSQCPSE